MAADDWRAGRGVDENLTLLDNEISYTELISDGALEFVTETHLRRWFRGRETITVGQALEVSAHIARKFWAIMRDEVLPNSILHQFAVDYAAEFLGRANPEYVDFRTHRALDAKQAWLDDKISLGELRVAEAGARAALDTVAGYGDERVSDCAFVVCQALADRGEEAQRRTFYTFLEHFGTRQDREWLIQLVRGRLGRPDSRWVPVPGRGRGQA
jgi:hypothetical protein